MDTMLIVSLLFLVMGVLLTLLRKHSARYMVEGHKDEWKLKDPRDEERWLEFRNGLIGVGSTVIGVFGLVAWFVA